MLWPCSNLVVSHASSITFLLTTSKLMLHLQPLASLLYVLHTFFTFKVSGDGTTMRPNMNPQWRVLVWGVSPLHGFQLLIYWLALPPCSKKKKKKKKTICHTSTSFESLSNNLYQEEMRSQSCAWVWRSLSIIYKIQVSDPYFIAYFNWTLILVNKHQKGVCLK